MTTVANGVNVQALLDAREVLRGAPEAAQFTWRASATWQSGVHSTIKVQSFFGLGEEQSHKEESVFEADHPEVFAAEDNGITPIEYLLVGLASCLTAGVASVAQNRGIQLRSVESTVEGAHDVRGILGADSDVRNGFNDVKVTFSIDADASERQEMPDGARSVRGAEPRLPDALARVDGRGRARRPRARSGPHSDVRNGFNDVKVTFTIDADASKQEIEALVAQSQKRSAVFDALTNPTSVTVEVA